MKLSFKTILPILLIFTLLILLAGCFITPSDEQPGYTPGTITGIIAAPCCPTTASGAASGESGAPEYWCYYCQGAWSLQNNVEVILTYGEDEIATIFTNEDGEYTFTDVEPGKNYVITALCPDYDDDRPLVKDVALEVVEGGSFDTKITDCVSTSLGLVVDFLVTYTELGPEDIVLDEVIASKPKFLGFSMFKALVKKVCLVLENCGNLTTDKDVQDALCKAAEEIGRKVLPDLDLQCTPGFTPTPGPGPTPDPCADNDPPVISSITPITATVGVEYLGQVNATDNDGTITKYELISGPSGMSINVSTGALSGWNPVCTDIPSVNVTVKVTDNCGASYQDTFIITVSSTNAAPDITSTPGTSAVVGTEYTYQIVATDTDCWPNITYSLEDGPAGMSITGDTISWTPVCADIEGNPNSVTVRATDDGSPALFAEQTFAITVSSTNAAPDITSTPGTSAVVGTEYTYQIVATDTDCWPNITYSLEDGPAGMSITGDTISWTPVCNDAGDNAVTVRATDDYPDFTDQSFTITVPQCGPCQLSDLSLIVKAGNTYIEVIPHPFDPSIMIYNIEEPQNASQFDFTASAAGNINYRYWRGSCAGNEWTPWSAPVSNTLTVEGLKICNNEVNTLEVKVDCGSSATTVYTVNIVPRGY